jgi:hypothetical protein
LAHIASLTGHMSFRTSLLRTDSLAMYGLCIKYESNLNSDTVFEYLVQTCSYQFNP